MSESKNKKYSSEFIESAVKLAVESSISKAHTARELGINPNTLYSWIDKYSMCKGTTTMKNDEHIYEEIKRLKKDLARVTQERDLLKKAAAYFAKSSQ